jgi:hypothetical protein
MQQKLLKKCCGYELRGNSTNFAAAHKQDFEFGLSCMAIATGGQQQKLQKVWLVVELSNLAIDTGGENAAKASKKVLWL